MVAAVGFLLAMAIPVSAEVNIQEIRWACGGGGYGTKGHPDNCGINPLGGSGVGAVADPVYGEAWIQAEERVLGVVVNGDARAFPVKMLDRHEIVNDVIGEIPVVVTYCPLCGSGITYEREILVEGLLRELNFTASGFLYRHDLVMWDTHGTLWTQILGEPIATLRDSEVVAGHHGVPLRAIATQIMAWKDWQAAYPGATMLQPVEGMRYGSAYGGYSNSCDFGISGYSQCDVDGLHPKELVIGVPAGPVAFPRHALPPGGVAIHEGNTTIVASADGQVVRVFDAGNRTFVHDAGLWWHDGQAWDLRTGTSMDGEALPEVDFLILFWFAWQTHQPETALWLPAPVAEEQEASGVALALLVAILVIAVWRRR